MENRTGVPIPEEMKRLPVWNGFPVPYVNVINDGVPDFRCVDQAKRNRCIRDKRCGVCGGDILKSWFYFIGGEACLEDRLFIDPAMHQSCCYYACKVCPFLAGSKRQHFTGETATEKAIEQGQIVKMVQPRPKRMIVYVAKRYEVVDGGSGILLCRPCKSPRRIDWNAMPESRE